MSFYHYWQQLDWEQLGLRIHAATPADVERALSRPRRTLEDFAALISPAAEAYLSPMAAEAERLTRQRFGHVVGFYLPLYLTNLCANDCSYCGFSMSNRIKRKVLDDAETTVAGAAMFAWSGIREFPSPEQARAQVRYQYRYFYPQTESELTGVE